MMRITRAALLLCLLGCAPEYEAIEPGQVRAFPVPIHTDKGEESSTVCLFSVPNGYDPSQSWPLLVALHGYGSSAPLFHDFWQRATLDAGFVLATPQGEEPTGEGIGLGWGPNAEQVVWRSLDGVTANVHIDRSQIFLTGFSQGGSLTYTLGLRHPQVFRGIAPLGASFDTGLLSPLEEQERLPNLRVYIGHGTREKNLTGARNAATALRALGYEVCLAEYPGVEHGLPEPPWNELQQILTFLISEE